MEEKCADPVMVEMNIDAPSPLDGYRGRFSVGGGGLHYVSNDSSPIVADYGRNASHLNYSVRLCESECGVQLCVRTHTWYVCTHMYVHRMCLHASLASPPCMAVLRVHTHTLIT